MIRHIPYMRLLLQDQERCLFCLMHRNQHRELRKMKQQGVCFKEKNKIKPQGRKTKQNKTNLKELPVFTVAKSFGPIFLWTLLYSAFPHHPL